MINYQAGEVIIKEGQYPTENCFYIIAQGSVDIFQKGNYLVTLGVGQQLGEMALFGNNEGRRNATVRAFTGIKLLKIGETAYKKFIDKIEKTYFKYSKVRPILDSSNSPFKGLNPIILDNIAARMNKEIFGDGTEDKNRILIKKNSKKASKVPKILLDKIGVIVKI